MENTDEKPTVASMSSHEPSGQVASISGPVLSLGPTRLLKNSEKNLLARLGLSTIPAAGWGGVLLVVLAELLLLCGAAGRMVSLQTSGQLDRVEEVQGMFWDMLTGEAKLTKTDTKVINTLHMITATLGHLILVPQLYIIVVFADENLTLVLQLVLAMLVMVLALVMQTVRTVLEQNEPEGPDCIEEDTCLHKTWAWMLFINIIIFLTIIFIRVLFNMRLKNLIVRIKCVGPIIEFCVSRRSRDFQCLVLIITLSVTVLSGMILNTQQLYSSDQPEVIESKTVELLIDLVSAMVCMVGLLVLVLLYFYSHTSYSHTRVVAEHRVEQELVLLGERHKQVLVRDKTVSKTKYCPVTRSARPGESGQLLRPA
eukprot:GFUD01121075.1.p1 GENE.GFUD01121075.1~~GFUD01121075.1.p1  ORF type:complete len:369 (-),score=128.57 GFUD01121075.1:74-1180(-)